jgi:hypothetical protein
MTDTLNEIENLHHNGNICCQGCYKIGLKEGVEAGDKFDVLEKNVDDTGRTYYKKLTTIKVDKKQIWDNRYMASEENTNSTIDRTLFDGSSKGLYPGLLIKQSK